LVNDTGSGGRLIITMPAYRAVRTLEKTVRAIPSGIADELILVDDASPDGTAELARELGLRVYVHAVNRGYGGNQKTCYTEALRHHASVVVMLHPDYQYEPEAVPLLVAPILAGRADVTFGSRFAGLGEPLAGGMPLYRYVGNRITTFLENLMLGSRFTETHSGMRAYTREALLSLPFLRYSDDFVFDSQLLVDAVTSGLRVVEVPIPTRYTKESSSIALGASLRYVLSSLAYCFRRSRERGRRGRRYPVAQSRRRTSHPIGRIAEGSTGRDPVIADAPDRAEPDAPQWTLLPQEAFGYVVRGSRLLVLTAGEPALPDEDVTVDVGVASSTEGRPDIEAFRRIARVIDEEGVLVVLLPQPADVPAAHRAAESLSPALAAAGFRLVEARGRGGSGRGPERRAAVIARPAATA
jgi:glycosyl transferase family 2